MHLFLCLHLYKQYVNTEIFYEGNINVINISYKLQPQKIKLTEIPWNYVKTRPDCSVCHSRLSQTLVIL